MRKFILVSSLLLSSACSSVPEQQAQQKQLIKTVATIVVVGAIAGAVGASQHKSKCDNNKAGFYRDNVTGNVYTC